MSPRLPLLIAVSLTALVVGPSPARAQRAVIVVPNAEPASRSEADPPLSLGGEDRALALTAFLRRVPVTTIVVTNRQRTQATAAYLAAQRRLTPVVVRSQEATEADALVHAIRGQPEEAIVVVVGEAAVIPTLLAGLGVEIPITLRDDEHDRVFVVSPLPTPTGEPPRVGLLQLTY